MPRLSPYLHCLVLTTRARAVDAEAFEIRLPAHDGLLGILPGHVPMLCELQPGVLFYNDVRQGEKQLFIEGGYGHVFDNQVTIFSPDVIRGKDITYSRAEEMLRRAEIMPMETPEQVEARTVAVNRARALMTIARRSSW